jgi:carbon-monoxide dehydrogenase large subunit
VLPAVVNCVEALKSGAPQIHDGAPGNKCYTWALGDKAQVDAAFANAAHVAKVDIVNNRLIPNAIEPRAVTRRTTGRSRLTRSMSRTRIRTSSAC